MTSGFAEGNQLSKDPVYFARQNAQRVPDAVLAPGREAIQRVRVAMEPKRPLRRGTGNSRQCSLVERSHSPRKTRNRKKSLLQYSYNGYKILRTKES